ncbi:hypothetical protein SUGI_0391610 [Cryptomeria japonica]|nr:hypothetical protein SUGI_0391610 [Cryptomeria japonica]
MMGEDRGKRISNGRGGTVEGKKKKAEVEQKEATKFLFKVSKEGWRSCATLPFLPPQQSREEAQQRFIMS